MDVFDGVAIVGVPGRRAENGPVLVFAGQLFRKLEITGLRVRRIAEIEKDAAADFLDRVGPVHFPALHGAIGQRGHLENGAVGSYLHAVVPALQPVAEVPALRQPGAAVGAAILDRMHIAVLVAPEDDSLTQARDADRCFPDHPTRGYGVPKVSQTAVDQRLGTDRPILKCGRCRHCFPIHCCSGHCCSDHCCLGLQRGIVRSPRRAAAPGRKKRRPSYVARRSPPPPMAAILGMIVIKGL